MTSQQQRILVTGATGFIGHSLCKSLVESDYKLRALIRPASDIKTLQQISLSIDFVSGDLLVEKSLHSACENIDVLIHLAGTPHVNNLSASKYQKSIVEASANVFRVAVANSVKKIVFLSSSLAEAAERNTSTATAYGRAKLEAEIKLKEICQESSTEYVILRPVNVYGLGMKGNLVSMISWIQKGILPPLPEVETKLSLVSVGDLVALILLVMESSKVSSNCYLISDGKDYRLLDIEREIYQSLKKKYPAWRSPHMLLYAAAGTAGLISKLLRVIGVQSSFSGISLRTYQNLIEDSLHSNDQVCSDLNFRPQDDFIKQLPAIVESKITN